MERGAWPEGVESWNNPRVVAKLREHGAPQIEVVGSSGG